MALLGTQIKCSIISLKTQLNQNSLQLPFLSKITVGPGLKKRYKEEIIHQPKGITEIPPFSNLGTISLKKHVVLTHLCGNYLWLATDFSERNKLKLVESVLLMLTKGGHEH